MCDFKEENEREVSSRFYQITYHKIEIEYSDNSDDELKISERRRIVAAVSQAKIQTNELNRAANISFKNQMAIEDIERFQRNKKPIFYESHQEVMVITRISQLGTEVFKYREEQPKIVLKHLRKKMWDNMKKTEEEITCPISLETIDDFEDFCLFGCGHHISRQSLKKLQKHECPVCKKSYYEMWDRNSWCSSNSLDED